MSMITVHHGIFRDIKLYVNDQGGGGRPVVMIHGWPLSSESFHLNVPALKEAGYRVITYDRRGFGNSDKPRSGYDYDTLTDDLRALLTELDLSDVTLVGFSMGGGEAARYATRHDNERVASVVLASAVPPYLLKTEDNPEGPLTRGKADEDAARLSADDRAFYDRFTVDLFSVGDELRVTEAQRNQAFAQCLQAYKHASLECMAAFSATDFRNDLPAMSVPVLILHGDSDKMVPFEGSGKRTHEAIRGSGLKLLRGAPHGCNVSHAEEWNQAVIEFLATWSPGGPEPEAVGAVAGG